MCRMSTVLIEIRQAKAADAAAAMKQTAQDLKGLGLIDVIVPEPVAR